MFLEFKTKNYKSFADELIFNLIPAPKQTGIDYSVQHEKIGGHIYKGLCSAVIYGPNASGKTNIIGAMDTMRAIVLRGNIRNSDVIVSPNAASSMLELVPNRNSNDKPTCFYIKFVDHELLFEYSITAKLGDFLNKEYKRKIVKETLFINEKEVFTRDEKLTVKLPSIIKSYLNEGVKSVTQKAIQISENSLNPEELFLNNGFKTVFSQKLVSALLDWIGNKLMVICRSDSVQTKSKFSNPKANEVYVEKTLNEAAKVFGVSSNALGYRASSDGEEVELCSVFEDKKKAIPAELFESYGTVRFINEFPLVIKALTIGGTLIMDEFDASIHPMALMNIINIFHNDEINKRHAQLVFNTHNPIFLSADLFRRDEIKFVERDENTGHSIHYSLSDFKTSEGTRKGEDYMHNYFVSKYGAIKDIDFSEILETIINKTEVKGNA